MQTPGPFHVTANVIRSFVLLAFLFALVFGLFYIGSLLYVIWRFPHFEHAEHYARALEFTHWAAPYIVLGCVAWIGIALALSGLLINWSSGCRVITPGSQPRLESILANLCRNAIKRRRLVYYNELPKELLDLNDPNSDLELSEQRRALGRAIANLPENQRLAFILCHYEEFSYAEAARSLDLSVKAVESLLVRAKRSLREQLSGQYRKQ